MSVTTAVLLLLGGFAVVYAVKQASGTGVANAAARQAQQQGATQPVQTATAIASAAASLLGAIGSVFQANRPSTPAGNATATGGLFDGQGTYNLSDALATYQGGL